MLILFLYRAKSDKERFESLGAKNVEILGNIKLAQQITTTSTYEKRYD